MRLLIFFLFISQNAICQVKTSLFEYDMQFNYNNFQSASKYDHKCQLYINDSESLYIYKNAISLSADPNAQKITTHVYLDVFDGESKLDYLECAEGGFQVYNSGDSLISRETINKTNYIIKEIAELNNWEYLDSTKIILNDLCWLAKKSHRGRTYFAWFNPEIPKTYHKGPWKLLGLPGLVYEAYSADGAIKFYLNNTKPFLVDYTISCPKNGIEISLEEYWEFYLAHRKSDFDRAHSGVIKNLINAGLDPYSYKFPIFHNSMEVLDTSLTLFKEWAIIKD